MSQNETEQEYVRRDIEITTRFLYALGRCMQRSGRGSAFRGLRSWSKRERPTLAPRYFWWLWDSSWQARCAHGSALWRRESRRAICSSRWSGRSSPNGFAGGRTRFENFA